MSTIWEYLSGFGPLVDSKSGEEGSFKDFKYKYLGLYFTATWCSYCVQIVNKLPMWIDKVNTQGQFLKLLTLRLDEDDNQFAYSYLRYKKISYEDVSGIASRLGARQIPSIYIFDIYGTLVTRNGLQDIMKHQEKTIEYWDKNVEDYYKRT